ncbi:MAG: hypothetical protein A3J28_14220 [Acidobacteria bacterium RIFCSPLOWO2_12_FULL_60_22]|nr:MAG: hypothetical protein A3J28_14220 [Acidobacteria bacterium RIFCSPLOWO2_12_FULL_60_22]
MTEVFYEDRETSLARDNGTDLGACGVSVGMSAGEHAPGGRVSQRDVERAGSNCANPAGASSNAQGEYCGTARSG